MNVQPSTPQRRPLSFATDAAAAPRATFAPADAQELPAIDVYEGTAGSTPAPGDAPPASLLSPQVLADARVLHGEGRQQVVAEVLATKLLGGLKLAPEDAQKASARLAERARVQDMTIEELSQAWSPEVLHELATYRQSPDGQFCMEDAEVLRARGALKYVRKNATTGMWNLAPAQRPWVDILAPLLEASQAPDRPRRNQGPAIRYLVKHASTEQLQSYQSFLQSALGQAYLTGLRTAADRVEARLAEPEVRSATAEPLQEAVAASGRWQALVRRPKSRMMARRQARVTV